MLYVRMNTEGERERERDGEFVVNFTLRVITSIGQRFPRFTSTAVLDLMNRNLLKMLIYVQQSIARNEKK